MDSLAPLGKQRYDLYLGSGNQTTEIKLGTLELTVIPANYAKQYLTVSKQLGGLEPETNEMATIEAFKNSVTPKKYWHLPPFQLPVTHCMNSPFGVKRFYNGVFSGNYHKGIDQKAPAGTPIKAITGGTIKIAKAFQLHGGTVAIDHGQGLGSIYIHMRKILVKPNQLVRQGDIIGLVGSTGFAMGPHLHWGFYIFGIPVNPQAGFVTPTTC